MVFNVIGWSRPICIPLVNISVQGEIGTLIKCVCFAQTEKCAESSEGCKMKWMGTCRTQSVMAEIQPY